MALITIEDLSFTYPGQTEPALTHLDLQVEPGDFIVLAGPSGCGKSTLLRQLKPALRPHGQRSGRILFLDQTLESLPPHAQAANIGFVLQHPDDQIVTDKVWHELAFGLESLGVATPVIRRRVAEMSHYFGITDWFDRDVSTLSGGQKQLLNLAAVMVMQPSLLILDEPTSQLDPIAAGDFLATVARLNRDLGTTVLLTEHRLEEALPLCSRVWMMDRGRLLCQGTPAEVGAALRHQGHDMFAAMPTPMRIWAAVDSDAPCPVTVREGRDWLTHFPRPLQPVPAEAPPKCFPAPSVELKGIWFRYERESEDVLRGLNLTAHPGELLCILGGNGAGKSTTLSLLSGQRKPWRGELRVTGRVAALPQDPSALFANGTLCEELTEMLPALPAAERTERAIDMARRMGLLPLLYRHPGDLSGGEQQRAALAKVLLSDPDILLLDEPTKGLDAACKAQLLAILQPLLTRGVTIIMVSHDIEFCAAHADRCALFFDGALAAEGRPRVFFAGNNFYTTAANRMARHCLPEAVTPDDVIAACGGVPSPAPEAPPDSGPPPPEPDPPVRLPLWRRILAGISALVLLGCTAYILRASDLTDLVATGDFQPVLNDLWIDLLLLVSVFTLALALHHKGESMELPPPLRITRRTVLSLAVIFLLVPLTIWGGIRFGGDRKYYLVSILVILETMCPFFLHFEGRKPMARELVIIAVLSALGVVSRTAFAMIPAFKPVLALVILSGIAFGSETGFLVGAMSMFASNMLFSQGPWTPWQMFAAGLIGALAGLLFRVGALRRSRAAMSLFGLTAAVGIYGVLMNVASVVMYQSVLTGPMILTALATGLPFDLVHGTATALFLWLFARPVLRVLARVRRNYGLMEAERNSDHETPMVSAQ